MNGIQRDYNRSMLYGDLAVKVNPFDIKKTQALARVGFTYYIK